MFSHYYKSSDPAQLVNDLEDGPSVAQRPRMEVPPGGESYYIALALFIDVHYTYDQVSQNTPL